MKTRGVPGPHRALEPAKTRSKTLTRIPAAGAPTTSIPVYSMPEAGGLRLRADHRHRLLARLLRRKLLIAGAALLGVLAGLGFALMITPVYRASNVDGARWIRRYTSPRFAAAPARCSPTARPESYMRNQVKLLESETLALRVANTLGITPPASRAGKISGSANGLEYFWRRNPCRRTSRVSPSSSAP